MKKGCLYFISGILSAGILTSLVPGVAADIIKTVEANLNTATVEVNGQKVDADNLEYNDTLYLPMRKVSEALDKDVSWDSSTNTAIIKDKVKVPDNVPSGTARIDSFQFSADSLTIVDSKTAEISYKMLDQYGKEYQNKDSKLRCSSDYGKASIDVENSKITIKDESGKLQSQKKVTVTIIDMMTAKTFTKTFTLDAAK